MNNNNNSGGANKVTLFHLLSATAATKNDGKTPTAVAKQIVEEPSQKMSTPNIKERISIPNFTPTEEIVDEKRATEEDAESLTTAAEFLSDFEGVPPAEEVETANEVIDLEEEETEMRLFASNKNGTQEIFVPEVEETTVNVEEKLVDEPIEKIEEEAANLASIADISTEAFNDPEEETLVIDSEAADDAPIEYLDDPDNFDTEDIDEAYRKRLIALGLESVESVELEETEEEVEDTEESEQIDEALSHVFANPPVKLNVTTPEPAEVTTAEQEAIAPTREHFSPLDFKVESEPNAAVANNASIPNTAAAKASMLQQFRQLQDRNSTFVFMFGRQQAGKTVILSSLAYHMGVDEHGLLETRRRVDNLKGAAYLKQLSESVRKGQFMNRTSVGSLYELDLTYTPNNPELPMNFTFLEMSGEDLTKVELSEASAGDLPSDIEVYLKCPNLNLVFMIVVPYEDAEEHDYLVIDFLDYLKERKPDFDYSKLLLLISKWDRYEGLRKDEVDVFVKEQMPRTYSRLKAKKATIARYSIGEVSDNNDQILELNMERPNVVKKWMYQAATGNKIKDENSSIWNKFKKWM